MEAVGVDAGTGGDHMRAPARLPLAACVFGGNVIGSSVAVVVLEEPWLWAAVGVSALLATVTAFRWRTVRQDDPSGTELLMAMGNVVFVGLAIAVVALAAYVFVAGASWVVGWLEWAQPQSSTWGRWAAAVVIVLFPKMTRDELTLVAPTIEPFELPLRQKAIQGGWLWWLGFFVVLALIAAVAVAAGMESWTTKVVWCFAVLLGASSTLPATKQYQQDDRYDEIVNRLAHRLQEAGYSVVVNPVTNDVEVDRSLGDTDIIARADGQSTLLVDVRLDAGTVMWSDVAPLMTAATVCERWLDDGCSVEPLLVLVDTEADDTISRFFSDTPLRLALVRLASPTVELRPQSPELEVVVAAAVEGVQSAVAPEDGRSVDA